MEKDEAYFYNLIQSRIAPIYFFDSKKLPSQGEKITTNETLTLFKRGHKVFGITNLHVYEEFRNARAKNSNIICQIGNKLEIKLEERLVHPKNDREKQNLGDLCIFFLYENELESIGAKGGFYS